MADKGGVDVDILAEDNRLASFCLGIVEKLGIQTNRRRIRIAPIPKTGAGYTWLYKKYPEYIARQRKRAHHHNVLFVVGLDADTKTFDERLADLERELEQAGMDTRSADERVACIIPKRNIETWVKHFDGSDVDEEVDFKNKVKRPDFKSAADAFVREFNQFRNEPDQLKTLPSLRTAYEEIVRLMGK